MAATKPEFHVREYAMKDGRITRPLVKQLTRSIGIRRTDDTKRSPYVMICIETGLRFGPDISRQADCVKLAEDIQAIVDDAGCMHTMSQAIDSYSHCAQIVRLLRGYIDMIESLKS